MTTKRITVIGAGYWGKNLVRNFHALGTLAEVCDASTEALQCIREQYKGIDCSSDLDKSLARKDVQGVVISTPAATHFEVTRKALAAHKNVFVEKPLALNYDEAQQLVAMAQEQGLTLMVGHLLQYHPGLLRLRDLVYSGELGDLEYIYSNRLNLGKIRREENALWSFAPHDISIMLWLTQAIPIQVTAVGGEYLQANVPDTTISTFRFESKVRGHIYVSWLHPFKEQRLVVVGSKRMASFDDRAEPGRKLLMYEKTLTMVDGNYVAKRPEPVPVSFDDDIEPLRAECEHFLHCMQTREQPRTNGEEGLRVLKVLQSCQRSLQMNGEPVQVTG